MGKVKKAIMKSKNEKEIVKRMLKITTRELLRLTT